MASLGGAQRFNAQMTVQGLGLDPNAYKWVAIGGGDGPALQALDTGRTQLASLSHLGAAMAEGKGFAKTIHVVLPHTATYTPPMPRLVVVAPKKSWIKDHEDAATLYVEMMLDMMRQWQDHADAWITPADKIFANSGVSDAQLQTVWQRVPGRWLLFGEWRRQLRRTAEDHGSVLPAARRGRPTNISPSRTHAYDTGPLSKALDKMGVVKPGRPGPARHAPTGTRARTHRVSGRGRPAPEHRFESAIDARARVRQCPQKLRQPVG